MNEDVIVLSRDTGAELDDYKVLSPQQQSAIKVAKRKQKLEDEKKLKTKNNYAYSLILYKCQKDLLDNKISGATLSRFICLSTYIKYGTDTLVKTDNKTIIKIDDLDKILNLKSTAIKKFVKDCKDAELMHVDADKVIHINTNYVLRDKVNFTSNEQKVMKLYHKTIRDLYKRIDTKSHEYMAYIFMLIPYVNRDWNIVCSNPEETDFDCIEDLKLKDLAEVWGYDITNLSKLKSTLWKIRFDDGKLAINFIAHPDLGEWRIVVNPHLYYVGTEDEEINKIAKYMFW